LEGNKASETSGLIVPPCPNFEISCKDYKGLE